MQSTLSSTSAEAAEILAMQSDTQLWLARLAMHLTGSSCARGLQFP